jgi:hypothetical protein
LTKLCKHQIDQFFTAHVSQIVLSHCDSILPNLAKIA